MLALVIGACGGGGGGGGDDDGGGPPPPPSPISYAGETGPLALTTENAPEVVGGVLNAISIAVSMASLAVDTELITSDVNRSVPGPDGGKVDLYGSLVNGMGELTVSYAGFSADGITVDGQFVQTVHRASNVVPTEVTLDISRLTISLGSSPVLSRLIVSGQVSRQQMTGSPALRNIQANLIFRDEISGEEGWLRDVVVSRQPEEPKVGNRLVETYGGQIYDAEQGAVSIGSTGGIWFDSLFDEGPPFGGGALKVSSDGRSVRARPMGRGRAALLFDDADDGVSDRFRQVAWEDLLAGTVPAPAGSTPPVPASVHQGPTVPGESLDLLGFLSADPDGDWLTVHWHVGLSPADGGELALSHPESPEAGFTPPVTGDYLLTFQVSDGAHTAWDSARITVTENPPIETDIGDPVAVFRRMADAQVGVGVLLDAIPSFTSKHEYELSYRWEYPPYEWTETSDGVLTYVPEVPGIHGLSLRVCRAVYSSPCDLSDRVMTAGMNLRYFHPATFTIGRVVHEPAVGDFNGDGRKDLALPSRIPGGLNQDPPDQIDFVFSTGGGYLRQPLVVAAGERMAVGDLNGDEIDDLAVVSSSSLSVVRGSADGNLATETFVLSTCQFPGTHVGDALAIADANADGRLDLLHLDTCAGEMVVRLQEADGTLGPQSVQQIAVSFGGQLVALGDLNADGRADVLHGISKPLVGGSGRGMFLVLLAQDDGSYADGQSFSLDNSTGAPAVVIADVTGDGLNDAVALDYGQVMVARQLEGGVLADPVRYPVDDNSPGRLHAADFDGDGRLDVRSNSKSLFLQGADGQLKPPLGILGDIGPTFDFLHPIPIDLNGDGYVDLVGSDPSGYSPTGAYGPTVLLGRPPDG